VELDPMFIEHRTEAVALEYKLKEWKKSEERRIAKKARKV
jgi:predicted GIY-YIG superfamily endonuclease